MYQCAIIVRALQPSGTSGKMSRLLVLLARMASIGAIASQLLIQRALGIRTFDNRLDDQLGAGNRIRQRRDAAHRGAQALAVHDASTSPASRSVASAVAIRPPARAPASPLAVGQPHLVAAEREHQRQRVAHQARADNGDLTSCSLLPPTARARAA